MKKKKKNERIHLTQSFASFLPQQNNFPVGRNTISLPPPPPLPRCPPLPLLRALSGLCVFAGDRSSSCIFCLTIPPPPLVNHADAEEGESERVRERKFLNLVQHIFCVVVIVLLLDFFTLSKPVRNSLENANKVFFLTSSLSLSLVSLFAEIFSFFFCVCVRTPPQVSFVVDTKKEARSLSSRFTPLSRPPM